MAHININMNPLKKAIFDELRLNLLEFDVNQTDEELNSLFFHTQDSLRLTLTGFRIVKKVFTAYSFEMPTDIKTKHRLGLSKMEFPYFFTQKRIILFSEMDAMVVKLHGGINGFLEGCYRLDH